MLLGMSTSEVLSWVEEARWDVGWGAFEQRGRNFRYLVMMRMRGFLVEGA